MVLRWTNAAVTDLEGIADYLSAKSPEHAPDILRALYESPAKLAAFPFRGRPGVEHGTREFVLAPLPYLVVYRVENDSIQVLRILHGTEMAVNIGDFPLAAGLNRIYPLA